MEFLGSTVVYTGLVAMFLGCVSRLRPLLFLGMASRLGGVVVLACGVSLVLIGFSLPTRETWIVAPQTQLDRFAPVYQFHEVHSIRVKAPRAQVFRAIEEVRAGEILLFRTLTWMRRGGRSGGESILNAPENQPLLEVATRTSFLRLAEEPEREIVVGTIVQAPAGWRPDGGAAARAIAGGAHGHPHGDPRGRARLSAGRWGRVTDAGGLGVGE